MDIHSGSRREGYKVLLLDAGGTILRRSQPPWNLLQSLLMEIGEDCTVEQANQLCVNVWVSLSSVIEGSTRVRFLQNRATWLTSFRRVFSQSIDRPEQLFRIINVFERSLRDNSMWQLYPEVEGVLKKLEGRIDLGIVSNWNSGLIDRLRQLGIDKYFKLTVISEAEGVSKPNPRIFLRALEQAGVEACEALHVGNDYRLDVLGAKAAGLDAVLIDRDGVWQGRSADDVTVIHELSALCSLVHPELGHSEHWDTELNTSTSTPN